MRRHFSHQPNVPGQGIVAGYSPRFWGLVALIGVAAGVGAAILTLLLNAVQYAAWDYRSGSYLGAVMSATAVRHVVVLLAAGVIAGVGGLLIKRVRGSGAGEISEALWLGGGRLSFWRSQTHGVLSIVIVGMGASLGREGAPQLTGAAVATVLSEWAKLPAWQRRLLVACGAGAGMAAVYNVPLGRRAVCGRGPARHPVAPCRAAGGGDERDRDRGCLGCGSRPAHLPGPGLRR